MTDEAVVSVKSLMIPKKEVEIDFPGFEGMTVTLAYLARSELLKIRKKCVTEKFSRRTHQVEETLNEKKFLKVYCNAVIKGWKGFKYQYLEELLLVDIGDLDPDDLVPFNEENIGALMENSTIFDSWVTETVGELENFTGNK